jgi:hypothetical protein
LPASSEHSNDNAGAPDSIAPVCRHGDGTMRIRKWDNFTTGSTDSTWGSGCSRPWSLPRT